MATKLKKRTYSNIIINDGDLFDRIYILIEGKVKVKNKSTKFEITQPGDYFGDIYLFVDNKSQNTYQTDGNLTTLYELELYQIVEILGSNYANNILQSIYLSATLGSTKLKNYLIGESMPILMNIFRLEYYPRNSTVYSKNLKINKKICIIISGKLVKKTDVSYIVAKSDELFGEDIIDSTEK